MKKIKYLSVLLVLGFLFVSCEKQQEKEWKKFYGYTNSEIVGSYSNSYVDDAFDGLTEGLYCHICDDARINITADSDNTMRFAINSAKAALNVSLAGPTVLNENEYMSNFEDGAYELLVRVYTNAKGQVRLHGYVRKNHPSLVNYYFDVIKN